MFFSLDVIRARKGDCLLMHYGSAEDPRLMMIDGGPASVYAPHLKPRLEQLRAARGLADAEPLSVDVLMVSHVDDDHIRGILDLTAELRELRQAQSPLFLKVRSLWHNSFDDLLKTTPEELKAEAGFGAAALAGEIDVDDADEFDAAKVLASIPQGRNLRLDAEFLKWKPNKEFNGELILATDTKRSVSLVGGVKFTIAGPMQPELVKLQKAHDKWLRDQKKKKKAPAAAALAAFVDESIPNLSSIVGLAEADGKSMLLTGDARGDKILKGLQLAGVLGKGPKSKMHVDLLKVPHHGSSNNLETSFFERITADHYVFSGDGEHGNPERESLEMLLEARPGADYTMHFTYPIAEIDVERKKEWEKQQAREKKKQAKVRENWSAAKHSLAALFKDKKISKKVRIVEDSRPHVIDLHDKLMV
jgi:beta-lactamase superfamily II metal-dependent hydrolase